MRTLWITIGLCLVAGCFGDLRRAADGGSDAGMDADTGVDEMDASDGSTFDAEAGAADPDSGDDTGPDAHTMDATPDAEGGMPPIEGGTDAPIDPDGGTTVRMELLSVTRAGTSEAFGRVVDNNNAIDCGGDCNESYALGTTVTLTARNINGSNTTFAGWAGSCASFGLQRTCTLVMNEPHIVAARFEPLEHNLVFMTAEPQATNLGVTEYDKICNERASYIGVNNVEGNGFIAWIGTSNSLPSARLGTARGFVRIDGRAFSDRVSDLIGPSPKIWNAIVFNELGVQPSDLFDYLVMTGIGADGTAPNTCLAWNSESGSEWMTYGSGLGGPGWWSDEGATLCNTPRRLVCMQKMYNNAIITPAPATGANIKRAFLSKQAFVPGGGVAAADALCNSVGEKPDGVGNYRAWLSTTSTAAADVMADDVLYVSPELQPIATGQALKARNVHQSGIWQHGDKTFTPTVTEAWTGAPEPTAVGTTITTCNDWMSSSASATATSGRCLTSIGRFLWEWHAEAPCDATNRHLYCIEQ